MSEGLRTDLIYRIVYSPTSMEYAIWDGKEVKKFYTMKRALMERRNCPLKIVTLSEWLRLTTK